MDVLGKKGFLTQNVTLYTLCEAIKSVEQWTHLWFFHSFRPKLKLLVHRITWAFLAENHPTNDHSLLIFVDISEEKEEEATGWVHQKIKITSMMINLNYPFELPLRLWMASHSLRLLHHAICRCFEATKKYFPVNYGYGNHLAPLFRNQSHYRWQSRMVKWIFVMKALAFLFSCGHASLSPCVAIECLLLIDIPYSRSKIVFSIFCSHTLNESVSLKSRCMVSSVPNHTEINKTVILSSNSELYSLHRRSRSNEWKKTPGKIRASIDALFI